MGDERGYVVKAQNCQKSEKDILLRWDLCEQGTLIIGHES